MFVVFSLVKCTFAGVDIMYFYMDRAPIGKAVQSYCDTGVEYVSFQNLFSLMKMGNLHLKCCFIGSWQMD